MKCFKCALNGNTNTGGGCVLVAANTAEEAMYIVMQSEHGELVAFFTNVYNDVTKYEEVEDLSYNTDTPKIIFEHTYLE